MKISDRKIGKGGACFIVAEIGINHDGDVDLAKKLVDKAKEAGADAVKFQTFKTDKFLSKNIKVPKHVGSTKSFFEMLRKLELSEEEHYEISKYCENKEIIFISTPLDYESVDLLDNVGVPAFKIASCDLDNLPFLKYVSKKGKPIILSTGMGTLGEVDEAIQMIYSTGNKDLVLLHCISAYPPKIEDINLKAMETLEKSFHLPVGFSDHSVGVTIPLAAVALGACVVEKHFTLDKNMEGPDHAISADPRELTELIRGIRIIEKALGDGIKIPTNDEVEMQRSFRKSLVAKVDISRGTMIREDMLEIKRPGTGLTPKYMDLILGRIAKRDIKKDSIVSFEDV